MRTSPASLAVEEGHTRLRARRGLAIYFVVLVPLSAMFQTLMIAGSLSWLWALIWTPAVASVVAQLALLYIGIPGATLYPLGLVALAIIVAAIIFSRGRWTIRRVPEVRQRISTAPHTPQT
jgi:hypothetical protein